MLTLERFRELARDHTVIPLEQTVPADTLTPVSTYLTLRRQGVPSFLFESVERHDRIGRFSFVGIDPALTLTATGEGVRIVDDGRASLTEESVFTVLERISAGLRTAPASTAGFRGGLAGYLGYDAVTRLERIPLPPAGRDDPPEAHFGLYTSVVRFDHAREEACVFQNVIVRPDRPLDEQYQLGLQRLQATVLSLRRPAISTTTITTSTGEAEDSGPREGFERSVRRAQSFIREGEIFQVVLSRRLTIPYAGDPFAVYRSLRRINPSPYLFYLDTGQVQLAGSSPEVLVRLTADEVEVLPIAGTRRRGAGPEEDLALEAELRADRKERAEHVMLVDLGRNDVGRVCVPGTVEVPEFMTVERFSHVMHLVSRVRGRRAPGRGPVDVLRSCFPAGTVTGAPKVRAMQIISDLEGARRGVYGGAVGYLGLDGSMDMCIAIRTVVAHRGRLQIQSGAGVVAASDPGTEYRETQSKAEAMVAAVRGAAGG